MYCMKLDHKHSLGLVLLSSLQYTGMLVLEWYHHLNIKTMVLFRGTYHLKGEPTWTRKFTAKPDANPDQCYGNS